MDWPPYFVYLDEERKCRTCGCDFIFFKEEQQFWFETLGFWVQSEAVNCKKCRAKIRKRRDKIRKAQKELQEINPNLNFDNIEQLDEVIHSLRVDGNIYAPEPVIGWIYAKADVRGQIISEK